MRTAVKMEHHAGERFSGAADAMFVPFSSFIDFTGGLEKRFDKGIASVDVVMLLEFFVKVRGIESLVAGPIELEDVLDF